MWRMFPRGSGVEIFLLLMMLLVALGSGSVTLLGETFRSSLLTATGVWAVVAHAHATRDAGQRYEFGSGKLERAGHASIAVVLAVAGLWVASRAFDLIMAGESTATPLGLGLAATANAVHTIRTGILVWARASLMARDRRPVRDALLLAGASRLLPC